MPRIPGTHEPKLANSDLIVTTWQTQWQTNERRSFVKPKASLFPRSATGNDDGLPDAAGHHSQVPYCCST